MKKIATAVVALGIGLSLVPFMNAQVYSPKVLLDGQLDTTDFKSLAATLYKNAHATTEREKAEAIWRYLLTDGRFVKPGVFYHIPGWSYEEPMGEVLDPVKLLNSYGFGLCYQDGPLLQALWEAGGFSHTRVWFLTGHTVAEVFYEGKYHYYDSDVMGYTTIGEQSYKTAPVASVSDLERNPQIILSKLEKPKTVKQGAVDYPWYTADVRADAMKDLTELFSTSDDNYLYAYRRYPQGHTMDFVLRPGERMVRYYQNPDRKLRYMPYANDGESQREFPKDVGTILTIANGPRSEKDARLWSTGTIEYQPKEDAVRDAMVGTNQAVFRMPSPYVIIGAMFHGRSSDARSLIVETSVDEGHTWKKGSTPVVASNGMWSASPLTLTTTTHGSKNAVAGTYGYLVRFKTQTPLSLEDLKITTVFEFNPRTLPELKTGENHLTYSSNSIERNELPIHASAAKLFASQVNGAKYTADQGQGYWQSEGAQGAEMIFPVHSVDGKPLSGFSVGGRFLDLRSGLAPNKLTAEVRKVSAWPTDPKATSAATIAWSTSPKGPWKPVWSYDPNVKWPDGQAVSQMLRWPEVDRIVETLPPAVKTVYLKYAFRNLALDDIRVATLQKRSSSPRLEITHVWLQDGAERQQTIAIQNDLKKSYEISLPQGAKVGNFALILTAK